MRFPVNRSLPLAALVLLAACGGTAPSPGDLPAAPTGPAGDYPMVLGPAYAIGTVTYTPADVLNYDAVGMAIASGEGGPTVTVAHHTLPLPSYVEITALDTGKTIVARAERRGPMSGHQLVQLSPGAAAQLGLNAWGEAPVRVRRVNPPEADRALLRTGQPAPARMDTPKALLEVLRRKLPQTAPTSPIPGQSPIEATPMAPPRGKVPAIAPEPQATRPAKPVPADPQSKTDPAASAAASGRYVVQLGAFADRARAQTIAHRAGASLSAAGKVWRVRSGPFKTRHEAEAALAKLQAAGYSEARIQTAR